MSTDDESERLRRELKNLQVEYRRLRDSHAYRLGRLLIDNARDPRKWHRLPGSLYTLWRDSRSPLTAAGPGTRQYQAVESSLKAFAADSRTANTSHVIFLFSGTTYIQDTRGNRPIRQTQALLRRGVPVIFSYHRSRPEDPLPEYKANGLVQSPVDITLQKMAQIASADYGSAIRIYIISYPHPGVVESIKIFRDHGWIIFYDCRDDWEEFSRVGMANWYHAETERRVLSESDVTLCVSKTLYDKMQSIVPHARILLSPNAVEADFVPAGYIRKPQSRPKIIGYFGHLSEAWFDWPIFLEIARQRPEYHFEIIGHSEPPGLQLPKNVTLLGPKPWRHLPACAESWSAAIIPFKIGKLSDGVDPIKIYEYLSLGLPVVSFTMPQISDYPYTWTVRDIPGFCSALDEACDTAPDMAAVLDFIGKNTWERRASELLELAGNCRRT